MDMLQPLIERLRLADLSQVAAKAALSRRTLVRICDRTNSPTFDTAEKIVAALDALGVKKVKPSKKALEEIAEGQRS